MNVSTVTNPAAQIQQMPNIENKRAQLQAMLLKKSVEMQNAETVAVMQQTEGKGQNIDIRC
ncbi:MAG TPA: hypothetical protein VMI31_02115 [Fimbriimonadaceae bacterium]|nr:hypothetical protein [Fimbriimonadaceae bacterium]